jgi:hypothetical protein
MGDENHQSNINQKPLLFGGEENQSTGLDAT